MPPQFDHQHKEDKKKMPEQEEGSVESSLNSAVSSNHLQHSFEYESDLESINSCRSRKKSSDGRCDISTESSYVSFLLQDPDDDHKELSSSSNASDDEQEEGHKNITVCSTISFKSYALIIGAMEEHHHGVMSLGRGTTSSILCETDSLSFHQISLRRRHGHCYLMKRDESNRDNHSKSRLKSSSAVKKLIPHFAVIEWDDDSMLKRHQQRNDNGDSSSEEAFEQVLEAAL